MIREASIFAMLRNLLENDALILPNAGAPTDGTSGTGVDLMGKGSLIIDTTNGQIYVNTNTKASPTWAKLADAIGDLPLAEGNMLKGNASGLAAAFSAKVNGQILVGDGTTVNSVAVTGDVTVNSSGVTAIGANKVLRSMQSVVGASKNIQVRPATIATTGNTDDYIIVPETGSLTSADFSGVDALAASDTNYVTFSITNLGQAGAGSAVMLAATDANTTKVTGGTALAANTKRALTLTAVSADKDVVQGDRLRIRAAATGTLANTVTFPTYLLRFGGTT